MVAKAGRKLGFIGCGNMAGAIMSGILRSGILTGENIMVYDINPIAVEKAMAAGVNIGANIAQVCEFADMVLMGVKPIGIQSALKEAGSSLKNKAVLSIVAGTSSEKLLEFTGTTVRVLRIMPNTPALVGEGATVLCADTDFTDEEKDFAQKLFESVGKVEWLAERYIDAVTGLSGGGPAYVAMFIEAMADGGVKEGLPRDVSMRLASQTVLGTAKMLLETGMHPGAMKDMVSSPAGTTIEGVEALEQGGLRHTVIRAIVESAEKSKRLL